MTIIVPIYNEEDNIEQLKKEMDRFFESSAKQMKASVLFVNDGSTDRSQQMIERLCHESEQYAFIELDQNRGLSTAIKAGISEIKTELIGYIDADLQTHPIDFLKLLPYSEDYELVSGIRLKRNDGLVKVISSKIANWFRRLMINDGIQDTGCPLKIIHKSSADAIPFFDGMHRFIPALIQLQNGKIKQVPIPHYERYAGTSKYHLFNRLRKPFVDTFAYNWMKSRYIRYQIKSRG